ncbi:tripartite tricarboxylate transporter TctB family protein [Paenibacillus daejeonensis]|uniref:tripartite tricarboxylate transporter TctB family protein n=1 Tax=Paenibacillus daejeonensis TaxID=135193 RepID=UPI0003775C0D|nr:tripartite tricarboxylate transporter TctB family protein [Paenibacillus daejeonensis]
MADRIFSIAVLLFAALFFYESRTFATKNATQTLSSAFYPRVIIAIMTIFAIVVLVRSFTRKVSSVPMAELRNKLKEHWRIPVMFVLFFVYIAVLPVIGFIWSTVTYLLIGFLLLEPAFRARRLMLYVPASVILTIIIFFIFERQLNIVLP